MFAIHATCLRDAATLVQQVDAAANAGLDGLELFVSQDGPLTLATSTADLDAALRHAQQRGVRFAAVGSGLFFQTQLADPQPALRAAARDLTLRLLDLAARVGAPSVVVIPAIVGRAEEPRPRTTYTDAMNHMYDALCGLAPQAEDRGVCLTVENAWTRFLLSPLEALTLIDRVNSPQVGICLDTGNVLAFGYPEDWIRCLGGRLRHLHAKDFDLTKPGRAGFCAVGDGSVDWPAVRDALADVGYCGPVVYEGAGEPRDVLRRLQAALGPPDGGSAPRHPSRSDAP